MRSISALAALLGSPTWNGSTFADGSTTIREIVESLVNQFAASAAGSPVEDAAAPASAAFDVILGRERGADPDLGVYDLDPVDDGIFEDGLE